MQRIAVMLVAALAVSSAFAADFKPAHKLTNSKFQALYNSFNRFGSQGVGSGAYTITRKTDAHGRSEKQLRYDMLKEMLHRKSGAFLDEGIELREVPHSAAGAAQAVATLSDWDQEERPYKQLTSALKTALADKAILVYSGSGSGNNTMAVMICVYDTAHDQVAYLMLSNFGSDD
jgi:opacity protein-like surface antigen